MEYMTGGTVVILGDVGDNLEQEWLEELFVYDPEMYLKIKQIRFNYLAKNCNRLLDKIFKKFSSKTLWETLSEVSKKIINNFDQEIKSFIKYV